MLRLVLLSTVGFFTNQRSAEQSGTPMRESREVLLVYLLSWGVLVPIFPLHFVSLTATVLATTQVLLYILLVPRESSETALNLSFREALKAVCLNLMGFSLASIAEQQYRTNYARAHLYKHEQSSLNDVRNEVVTPLRTPPRRPRPPAAAAAPPPPPLDAHPPRAPCPPAQHAAGAVVKDIAQGHAGSPTATAT